MLNGASLMVLSFPAALSWSSDGHATVADTAVKYFDENANKTVADIMGEGTRLADYSTWADSVLHGPDKEKWKWSAGLHFAEVDNCTFVYEKDCKNDYCVVGAIKNYTRQVADENLSLDQRQVALKFLTHFMGDVRQPLHLGRKSDDGGEQIFVYWDFADVKSGTLRKVWDEKLIDEFEWEDYGDDYIQQDLNCDAPVYNRAKFWNITVKHVEKKLAKGGLFHSKISEWLEDCEKYGLDVCVNNMASESALLACKNAYKHFDGQQIHNNHILTWWYYSKTMDIVQEQLAKGAIRLAWVMNNVTS